MTDYGGLWRIMTDYALHSLYEFGNRIETLRICIHSQFCKAVKIPKRVWNSAAQLVTVKPPASMMLDMVRCGVLRIMADYDGLWRIMTLICDCKHDA